MLMTKERLLSAGLAYKRLTDLSLPRRFPIVPFPNLPLIIAFLAGAAGRYWFRRLLGLAFVILMMVRVAHALHA
jgi:hypothetical protein